MEFSPKLKPLYANLKRLKIGNYLESEEFNLYALENNFDQEWILSKSEASNRVMVHSYNSKEVEETAFMQLMCYQYEENFFSFHHFILPILLYFSKWSETKLDYTDIISNLRSIKIDEVNILLFVKEFRKIQDSKPNKIEIEKIEPKKKLAAKGTMNEVFIVHGHDEEAQIKTARYIEKLGFKPIILHEQASSGKTIIEKIEKYSNVGFGIILYTPCDVGAKKESSLKLQSRARQNVVFEHGYLIGKIGRDNVCALVKGEIEKPNDISGVVYVSMDDANAWHIKIAKELKNSGYNVDLNKIM